MKKALVLALSLSLAGFAAQAQTAAVQPANAQQKVAGPQIQFEEMKYDFGSVKQGDVVEHVFKFKNTGTAPLVIANIGTTCGCTVPEWTKEPIMPGKSGTVMAKFNSTGKMGMQNKVLTVESNSTSGNAMVALVGEVKDAATATTEAIPAKTDVSTEASDAKQKTKVGDSKIKAKRKSS
ncbi:protein of unknown function DUF1573 [Hymenobacter roseosalivarius DSM 11622]|uniref:DUF1573 domain-containing protein n=1 Tax=Hymenobacter roseosalivarius DSM 11622 TaxID=645990 RepID=A0A1W1VXV6_9BACT|nr:DUF1573 domain-containing protein [Hymenobacter roseosalivarius]SMB98080.1 protein of unknown function DUF1573 [Hymenobacter roseosalivarius DSM 11622]